MKASMKTLVAGGWSVGFLLTLLAYSKRKPKKWMPARLPQTLKHASKYSIRSQNSYLSLYSKNSFLSIGSIGSALSIGSIGSVASIFSIGSALSAASILSFVSLASVMTSTAIAQCMCLDNGKNKTSIKRSV